MNRVPGNTIRKDPNSFETKGMDWTEYLDVLEETISASVWSVEGGPDPDSTPLVLSNASVLPGSLKTQIWISGGTVGARYKVTNRITATGSPQTVDDRSFYVLIQDQ